MLFLFAGFFGYIMCWLCARDLLLLVLLTLMNERLEKEILKYFNVIL
jgi:hypothetical protein